MNIFYILNSRFPTIKAYGLQVAKTCQAFKIAGVRVSLIIPKRKKHAELGHESVESLYSIKEKFPIISLPSFDFVWLGWTNQLFFIVQQCLFVLASSIYMIGKKIDVIYSRDQFSLYFLSFFRRNLYWEVHRKPENPNSFMYRQLFSRLSGLIVITEGLKKDMSKFYGGPILVAPDGVDPNEFIVSQTAQELRQKLGLPLEKIIIMYTGQLFEWKGVDTLVAAAQQLNSQYAIIIVGGTPEDIETLKKLDTHHHVLFVGFKHHTQIPMYLKAADIVILPNKKDGDVSEFYTSPLKLFEYMAAGKAIIASDLPSLREILDETSAVFIEPDNPTFLARAIETLAANKEKKEELQRKVLSTLTTYTWDQRAKKILGFIDTSLHHTILK